MTRCYVCNAEPSDPCHAVDGEIAECPRPARATTSVYDIWRRQHGSREWLKTAQSLCARSDKDAQARLRRRFDGAGFSSMSLVAVPEGWNPNTRQAGGQP